MPGPANQQQNQLKVQCFVCFGKVWYNRSSDSLVLAVFGDDLLYQTLPGPTKPLISNGVCCWFAGPGKVWYSFSSNERRAVISPESPRNLFFTLSPHTSVDNFTLNSVNDLNRIYGDLILRLVGPFPLSLAGQRRLKPRALRLPGASVKHD